MRNFVKWLTGCCMFFYFLAGCKKEGEQFFVKEGTFSGNGLLASSNNVVMTAADEGRQVLSYLWSPADFGDKTVIKYSLQLDVPGDTSGPNAWSHAKTIEAGNNKVSLDFIAKDLNGIVNALNVPAGTPNKIVARVRAEVPQYNGSASSLKVIYSNSVAVNITSYSLSLYIPGAYQGWNPATAPELNPIEGRPGMYEGYINITGSGTQYFKFTNARDWDHINYGDGGNGTFSTDGLAAGLSVPGGGYYEVTADLNTNTWTATKTTWGIIGDATPGGWNTDTQMTYDETDQVWRVTCNMVSGGSFKFRANNAWTIDFGMDPSTGKLVYADNPFFGYTPGLWNLSVPADGDYTLTLDLHNSQHYTYTIVKN